MTRVSVQNVSVDSKQNKVYYRTFLSSAELTKPKMVLHADTGGTFFKIRKRDKGLVSEIQNYSDSIRILQGLMWKL